MNIKPSSTGESLSLGAFVDRRLDGGLACAELHDVYAGEDDAAAGFGFGLLLALGAAGSRPVIVVRDDAGVARFGRLYGDGIVGLGFDPAALIVVHTADTMASLRAVADAVACSELGAVVFAAWRPGPVFDLTASRRIALRARAAKVFTVVVHLAAPPVPSAAATRWQVRAAPSAALAGNAPGHPTFDLTLLHHRSGIAGLDARVEWNHDLRTFRDAPLSRPIPAVVAGRTRVAEQRRAA